MYKNQGEVIMSLSNLYEFKEFTVSVEDIEFEIKATVQMIGADLVVTMYGGEIPHIGAVAIAHPRPSLLNPDVNSSSCSVLCFMGHREDSLAKRMAEKLSAKLDTNVVLTAGMHWDNLSHEDRHIILENCYKLVDLIISKMHKK